MEIRPQASLNQGEPTAAAVGPAQKLAAPVFILAAGDILIEVALIIEAAKGELTRQQLIHHDPKGEHIRSGEHRRVAPAGIDLLRRHIGICAEDLLGHSHQSALGQALVSVAGNAEVSQGNGAVGPNQDVFRLEVTMNFPIDMERLEP